jgi:hypothetical protein
MSKEMYFVPSLQDPVSFYALCALVSSALDMLSGRPLSIDALHYKQETIKMVNERILAEYTGEEISDSTILAVALLWKLEVGGLQHVRSSGLLAHSLDRRGSMIP